MKKYWKIYWKMYWKIQWKNLKICWACAQKFDYGLKNVIQKLKMYWKIYWKMWKCIEKCSEKIWEYVEHVYKNRKRFVRKWCFFFVEFIQLKKCSSVTEIEVLVLSIEMKLSMSGHVSNCFVCFDRQFFYFSVEDTLWSGRSIFGPY